MDAHGTSLVDRVGSFARAHPEVVLFGVGLMLFVGGLASVLTGAFSTGQGTRAGSPQVGTSRELPTVGPGEGVDLGLYAVGRKEVLASRAKSQPRASTFAVVSFGSYRKVGEVESFFKARGLQVAMVHLRIPLPGFASQAAQVDGRVADAVETLIGPARVRSLREEASALEAILPRTSDQAYRAVYEQDISNLRKAIELMASDPSVIYGAVIKTTYANLAKLAEAPEVRLVDPSDDGSATIESHLFVAILPDQSDRP